uniref:Gnk2-homologous domain-containing protein n=1 Tax=Setaria italica TaxID=4555 RepID=K4ALE8_SETIT
MACPNRKARGLSYLILLSLVMAAAESGSALKLEPTGTSSHFPPLLDCAPAPAPAPAARSKNGTAFRANVLSLLAALPSAAASAPTGSTATRSSAAGRDRAFARGACFGLGAPRGSSLGDCISCLSADAQDVASGCGATSRRAGVWRAGCFLSYADTNASTAREDAFRGWFYDDDAPTTALGSQCTASRTAAECFRCLNESARVVRALVVRGRLSMVRGTAVVFVGYGCYLRVPLFPPQPRWEQRRFQPRRCPTPWKLKRKKNQAVFSDSSTPWM